MSQGNNVQLTCTSCGQPYLIQAEYQNSPHQCPLCGVMVGGQPMQQPGMPLQPQAPIAPGMQNPGMQNPGMQNPGMQQPGMQQPGMQQPGMQNPGYPNQMQQVAGQQPASGKMTKERVVFIIRCIVGAIALVAIIWTLIYILNRNSNITVELGDSSDMGKGGTLNAGTFDVKPGTTFKARFKINKSGDEDFQFKMSRADEMGATVSEDGQFVWALSEDVAPGRVEFRIAVHDRKAPIFIEFVKIAFEVQ